MMLLNLYISNYLCSPATTRPAVLCCFRNRMRWVVLEFLHVKRKKRAQRVMHWESYWATVSSESKEVCLAPYLCGWDDEHTYHARALRVSRV